MISLSFPFCGGLLFFPPKFQFLSPKEVYILPDITKSGQKIVVGGGGGTEPIVKISLRPKSRLIKVF